MTGALHERRARWPGSSAGRVPPLCRDRAEQCPALCLGSGASGGLFTPTLSTGAVLGAAAGIAWSLAWPRSPAGAYAIVGAAAMLGAAMHAPLTGLALMLELTSGGFGIMIPMVAATVTATLVARHVDGYSIYTARLRAR